MTKNKPDSKLSKKHSRLAKIYPKEKHNTSQASKAMGKAQVIEGPPYISPRARLYLLALLDLPRYPNLVPSRTPPTLVAAHLAPAFLAQVRNKYLTPFAPVPTLGTIASGIVR